jgi:4'-phosphopantetheinyl transferase
MLSRDYDYVTRRQSAVPMCISVLIAPDFVLSPALEACWLDQLPQARRADIRRWPDRRSRHRSLLGHRLLREGLRRLGHTGAVLDSLRYPPHARPTLDLPVDFSVSHCEGRILCALSTDGPIGVDVEAVGELQAKDFPLYLNAAERDWAGESARRFYSVWTRKEAVVKAAGSAGLPAVRDVDTLAGAQCAGFGGQTWRTAEVAVGRGHVAHLAHAALRDRRVPVTFQRISRSRLERDLSEWLHDDLQAC